MRSSSMIRLGVILLGPLLLGQARGDGPRLLPRDADGGLFPAPADAPARTKNVPSGPLPAAKAQDGTVAVPVVIVEPAVPDAPPPATDSGKTFDPADAAAQSAPPAKPEPTAKALEPDPIPTPAQVATASAEEAGRMFASAEARLKAMGPATGKGKGEAIREILEERKRWLLDWRAAAKLHHEAEHPQPSPERQATEARAELEKCRTILEQIVQSPDQPLPEIFRTSAGKTVEARLSEMKEAIDAARDQLKEQTNRLDALHAEANRAASGENAAIRARRDQLHQDFSTVTARRGEREAAVATATSPEARDLAAERLANFEWEARTTAEKLDTQEALIALAAKRLDVSNILVQAGEARVHLSKKLLDRMEQHYTTFAEAQRKVLQQAVALEQGRAAVIGDPMLKHRSRKNAELLALESQVVAYEKAEAASEGLSQEEQDSLADAAETAFAALKKLVEDGNLSTLDALRLKNEYRRIAPERDRVCQTELILAATELSTYENALSDAEVDMVNDSRDDRLEADSLLERVGPSRHREALAMLEELEARHDNLLNRRRDVLQKLAIRAEAIHTAVLRRIRVLDQQNAFIRTHIFWVRDAEPITRATLGRARGETARIVRATASIAARSFDRKLLKDLDVRFAMAATVAIFLPLPLWFVRRRIDRYRLTLLA